MANKALRRARRQAAAEALIRFGPELSGLKELQRQAQGTYRTDIRQAKDTALGISGAARTALPQIQKTYERAGGQLTNTWNQVDQDIAGAGGAPNSAIEQAMIAENAASRSRLREGRVESKRDLTNRIVEAQSGRAYANRAARGQLFSELGKVNRRRIDVLREKGAFKSATVQGLLEDALDRQTRAAIQRAASNQSERNSLRSAGIDPDTGAAIPGGRLDPDANKKPGDQTPRGSGRGGGGGRSGVSGSGGATPVQRAAAQDALGQARQWAGQLKQAGAGFDAVIQGLTQGRPAKSALVYKTVTDTRTGRTKQVRVLNKDGTPKTRATPAIPKIGHELLVRAAAEAEFLGYLTRRTQRLLHSRGLKVRDLGLPPHSRKPAPRGFGTGGTLPPSFVQPH